MVTDLCGLKLAPKLCVAIDWGTPVMFDLSQNHAQGWLQQFISDNSELCADLSPDYACFPFKDNWVAIQGSGAKEDLEESLIASWLSCVTPFSPVD
ncbi:hypothetical protein AV530_005863 [Patagioenas fasciata monilis]|uniref:Uncharacterized protein n=1 Tax=Patagioenas fasciata monilis TaxID=372326 RepID=A0A1V4JMX1_PATFA|nr:hypothetical protein AV530_005863 [Patagioenas fasciata monilis]